MDVRTLPVVTLYTPGFSLALGTLRSWYSSVQVVTYFGAVSGHNGRESAGWSRQRSANVKSYWNENKNISVDSNKPSRSQEEANRFNYTSWNIKCKLFVRPFAQCISVFWCNFALSQHLIVLHRTLQLRLIVPFTCPHRTTYTTDQMWHFTSGVTRNSGAPGQISKSSPPFPFPTCPRLPLSLPLPYLLFFLAPCGAGAPLFPLVHLLSHLFPPFTFLFLSLALPIFFFCPSLPFLPE